MATAVEQAIIISPADLTGLKSEDEEYDWRFDPRFSNFAESRDLHHRPQAAWAGELQAEYGQSRRGPNARDF